MERRGAEEDEAILSHFRSCFPFAVFFHAPDEEGERPVLSEERKPPPQNEEQPPLPPPFRPSGGGGGEALVQCSQQHKSAQLIIAGSENIRHRGLRLFGKPK